ncbi:MAG: M56 family metallopeptidase, partial [Clostridia bacterium]|nr:M56 family metallopeptidase [Clostridia bacterium]
LVQVSLYYAVLLALIPWLRQKISALSCAALWMAPNALYLLFGYRHRHLLTTAPMIVLPGPGREIWLLLALWLAGFVLLFGWQILRHLRFRRAILRRAVPVSDPQVLRLWDALREGFRSQNRQVPLLVSPDIRTPLSIGLFRDSQRVVLPHLSYSEEDLRLALHHELVHLERGDAWSKFFLLFCTSFFWFVPLVWPAMRRSAEDLELSCDEAVLEEADAATRHRYASLLLSTAGHEAGFTTCLSASAKALRHRLKNVVQPVQRGSGKAVVFLALCAFCATAGSFSLAYDSLTGAEAIYGDAAGRGVLGAVNRYAGRASVPCEPADPDAFLRVLEQLPLQRLTREQDSWLIDRELTCVVTTEEGAVALTLGDCYLGVRKEHTNFRRREDHCYYLPEELVQATLQALRMPAGGG